jgi:DNA-binding protein Fis
MTDAMTAVGNNQSEAARVLGIHRVTLARKLLQFQIP